MPDSYAWIERSLDTIDRAHWYRSPQLVTSKAGTEVIINDRPTLMFASNNYLGLAGDQRLIDAAIAATQTYGTGATGSRLVSGHLPIHVELEKSIAQLKQTEAALVFSSGYLANIGTIAALVGKRDLILGDAYNHSCLKKGAILSGATVVDYAHVDMTDLAKNLGQMRSQFRRCLITTDSVFSMDGDLCPLLELMALAAKYDCMVLVDEAHATGVFGDRGAGLVNALAITQPLIQVGTLSKALGSLGGYVAGSAKLIDFLRNRAASWIYTTGLSPADTAAAIKAIDIVNTEPQRRAQLWQNLEILTEQLQKQLTVQLAAPNITNTQTNTQSNSKTNIKVIALESPIVAIEVGDIKTTLAVADQLNQKGIFAPAIRPPTVPTPRIRLTLIATHTQTQINYLISCLNQALQSVHAY